MTSMSLKFGRLLLGALALLAAALAPASAQDAAASFPNKPIRVVVPFAAGGGNDIFARLVGQKLSAKFSARPGDQENKPGAGGRIAAEYVMNQPQDGYTLFVGASGVMSIAAAAYPEPVVSPDQDLRAAGDDRELPADRGDPARPSGQEREGDWSSGRRRIRTSRTTPRPRRPSSPRANCSSSRAACPGTMIPYKSSNEMILSVMQGQTLLAISDGPPAMPMIKGGKVKALAVTGLEALRRAAGRAEHGGSRLPRTSTPSCGAASSLPVSTPAPIVAKLEEALRKAITDPDVSAQAQGHGGDAGRQPSAEFRAMIDKDIQSYRRSHQGGEPEVRQLVTSPATNALMPRFPGHESFCGAAKCAIDSGSRPIATRARRGHNRRGTEEERCAPRSASSAPDPRD